jgi:hypothetical protein
VTSGAEIRSIGLVGAASSLAAVFAAPTSPIPLQELYRRSEPDSNNQPR